MSIQAFKDGLSVMANGITKGEADAKNICVHCKNPVDGTNLRTDAERSEHKITGICGICWDTLFSVDGEIDD